MLKKLINHKKYLFIFIISILFLNVAKSDEIYLEGKKIFLEKGNCAFCHTLADAGSAGNIGPNLNEIKPDKMRVMNTVTNVVPANDMSLQVGNFNNGMYIIKAITDDGEVFDLKFIKM